MSLFEISKELELAVGRLRTVSEIRSGLSNSRVWKVEGELGNFALKSYPVQEQSWQRLNEIHAFQNRLETVQEIPRLIRWGVTSNGIRSPFLLESNGTFFELSSWRDGEPLPFDTIDGSQVDSFIATLIRIHELSARSARHQMIPSGIQERIEQFTKLESISWELDCSQLSHINREMIGFFRSIGEQSRHRVSRILTSLSRLLRPQICFWICRDLRLEHLLYRGGKLNGIIDFGASRVDVPIFDLVRFLSTSVRSEREDDWKRALERYYDAIDSTTLKLPRVLFQDLTALSEVSLILAGYYWLSRMRRPGGSEDLTEQARSRIQLIAMQLAGFQKWSS